MEELVDQLAENTHNVWAKERISQVGKFFLLLCNWMLTTTTFIPWDILWAMHIN